MKDLIQEDNNMKSFREYLNNREEVLNEGFVGWIGKKVRNMLLGALLTTVCLSYIGNTSADPQQVLDRMNEKVPPATELVSPEQIEKATNNIEKELDREMEQTQENYDKKSEQNQENYDKGIEKVPEATYDYNRGTLRNKIPNATSEVFKNFRRKFLNPYKMFKYGLVDGLAYGASPEEKEKVEEFIDETSKKLAETTNKATEKYNQFKENQKLREKAKIGIDSAKKGADKVKKGAIKGIQKIKELKK